MKITLLAFTSTDSDFMVPLLPSSFSVFLYISEHLEHVDSPVLRSLSAITMTSLLSFLCLLLLMGFVSLVTGHVFLHLCMSGHFWLDARHCELYIVGCWILLYSFK